MWSHLGRKKTIKSFTLSRVSASASLGTSPDILIELSDDGTTYENSQVSVIVGGVSCTSMTSNATTMTCEMSGGRDVSHIRITSNNGKSFKFTELEAIAEK